MDFKEGNILEEYKDFSHENATEMKCPIRKTALVFKRFYLHDFIKTFF